MDYDTTCFVVMPMGTKGIQKRRGLGLLGFSLSITTLVDFDYIFEQVFSPAIELSRTPEGKPLSPRRTDRDYDSGLIDQAMVHCLEYSRFVLCDITGLNPNVFYEMGHRHHACETGTAVYGQSDVVVPFNIRPVKVHRYEYRPPSILEEMRRQIAEVITTSLQRRPLDSPIQRALRAQREKGPEFHRELLGFYNAARQNNPEEALEHLQRALQYDPDNGLLHLRLGRMFRENGQWSESLEHIDRSIAAIPDYAEALKEKAATELMGTQKAALSAFLPYTEMNLRKALGLGLADSETLTLLGETLQLGERFGEAHSLFRDARMLVPSNPDPLLGEITTRSILSGRIELQKEDKKSLDYVGRILGSHLRTFGEAKGTELLQLGQIRLFQGKTKKCLDLFARGVRETSLPERQIYLKNLEQMRHAGVRLSGLDIGIDLLGGV